MDFFSPIDEILYPPCGMFSIGHILTTIICLAGVGLLIHFTRNMKDKTLLLVTRISAVVFTILEMIKITYNFYYGYTWIDAWVPLAYCSLFIYSLWILGFTKGRVQNLGRMFMICGGIVGGFSFLMYPSTSLTMHPLFHFLCFHSMIFHSSMLYFGLIYLLRRNVNFSKKDYFDYCVFCGVFIVTALIINYTCDSNLMLMNNPFNLPKIVKNLFEYSSILYTVIVAAMYFTVPYFAVFGLSKLIYKKTKE